MKLKQAWPRTVPPRCPGALSKPESRKEEGAGQAGMWGNVLGCWDHLRDLDLQAAARADAVGTPGRGPQASALAGDSYVRPSLRTKDPQPSSNTGPQERCRDFLTVRFTEHKISQQKVDGTFAVLGHRPLQLRNLFLTPKGNAIHSKQPLATTNLLGFCRFSQSGYFT